VVVSRVVCSLFIAGWAGLSGIVELVPGTILGIATWDGKTFVGATRCECVSDVLYNLRKFKVGDCLHVAV
jgi:hypothetical protein